MNFRDHFSAQAADYAKFRPHYPTELFDYLSDIAPDNEIAWDCATGNGQAAVALASKFRHVIATDASEKQIKNAARHERIDYRVATAEKSGISSDKIDTITVAQALHWFDLDFFRRRRSWLTLGDHFLRLRRRENLRQRFAAKAAAQIFPAGHTSGHTPAQQSVTGNIAHAGLFKNLAVELIRTAAAAVSSSLDWQVHQSAVVHRLAEVSLVGLQDWRIGFSDRNGFTGLTDG